MAEDVMELVEQKNEDRSVLVVVVDRDKESPAPAGARLEVVKAGVIGQVMERGKVLRCKYSDAVWLVNRANRWKENPLTLVMRDDDGTLVAKKLTPDEAKEKKALVKKAVEAGVAKEAAEAMGLLELRALVN